MDWQFYMGVFFGAVGMLVFLLVLGRSK